MTEAIDKGHLRRPTPEDPLRIVDLGCGNAYLTFAAHRFLTSVRGLPVRMTGVDVTQQSRDHNAEVATELGDRRRLRGRCSIADAHLDRPPEVVLALHACDTATDEALARAVEWEAPLVLAAPCCHHDIAAQLRRNPTPAPYAMLTRHGILRERFADTLTDALRASLLRLRGYRVDVMQFVESKHTPRNTMLRAVRTGGPVKGGGVRKEYDDLVATWAVRPRLAELLEPAGRDVLMRERVVLGRGAAALPRRRRRRAASGRRRGGLPVPGPGHRRGQRPGRPGRAVRDHQRLRRHRPGLHRRPGHGRTVGVTTWASDARGRRGARARRADGEVWVGDIGDNRRGARLDPGDPRPGRRGRPGR